MLGSGGVTTEGAWEDFLLTTSSLHLTRTKVAQMPSGFPFSAQQLSDVCLHLNFTVSLPDALLESWETQSAGAE